MRKHIRNVICIAVLCALFAGCGARSLVSPDGKISVAVDEGGMTVSYLGDSVQRIEFPMKDVRFDRRSSSFESGETRLEVRVLDGGVGFRFRGVEPRTAYVIPDGTRTWMMRLKTDYEGFYRQADSVRQGQLAYPALVEYSDGVFGLIAEAGLEKGHSASHLFSADTSGRYYVETMDEDPDYEVSPWRMLAVGTIGDIAGSTLVEDLSAPCALDDVSWIKPGLSSWIYWAHNHGSKDFRIVKEYIDLAAEMKWPYCLIDWEWPEMENGGTLEDALEYAREKGVKINVWYNSGTSWVGESAPQPQDRLNTPEAREKEMSWLESIGVTGIKVDFFSPDGKDMVNYYIDILEDAAKHRLLVNFHGCTIPRGWQRTYPNLVSMESVFGAEWYNNGPMMTRPAASHNATIPFTRNVMGPMDYTPGTFSDSRFPHITTYAHELALPVIFRSTIQHMPDTPETYRSLPEQVRRILSGMPSVWDESHLLSGYPGHHAVFARRSGSTWYVAGINGTDEPLEIDLGDTGRYSGTATLVCDGETDRSFAIDTVERLPSKVICRPLGGFICVIKK